MSKVQLAGNASGTGIFQIASPNSNTDRTLTLPDNTGTIVSTGSTGAVSQAMLATNVAGNGPAFSAYMSGISQSFTTSVQTKVQCNTEEFDTASCYDSSTNYRFTPNVAGYYQFNGCFIGPGSATGIVAIAIYKNGTLNKWGGYILNGVSSNQPTVSALIYANGTTDYFELYALQSSGTTYNTGSGAHTDIYFQAFLARTA